LYCVKLVILTQQTLQGPWNPDFEMRTEENRFFSLPALNLSLSYLQVLGRIRSS
jgi:hypothetical protein